MSVMSTCIFSLSYVIVKDECVGPHNYEFSDKFKSINQSGETFWLQMQPYNKSHFLS